MTTFTACDGRVVRLTPGVLDDDGAHALANGLCLQWAIACAERGGGRVVVVCDSFNGDLEDDGCPVSRAAGHGLHAVLQRDGLLVDVDGCYAPDEALAWFGPGTYLLPLTLGLARALAGTAAWARPQDACTWVGGLVARQTRGSVTRIGARSGSCAGSKAAAACRRP